VSGLAEIPAGPAEVQGAWRRRGRTVEGSAWAEVSAVLWLQAGRHFCDVRSPLPGAAAVHPLDVAQAFSGTIEVMAGRIAFSHDIDTERRDPGHPDESTVHRAGEVLMERGPGFEERWVLASLPGDAVAVAELWGPLGPSVGGPRARIVRVGDLALGVWGGTTPGGARYSNRSAWEPEAPGPRAGVFGVDDAVQALVFGGTLPDGWTRRAAAGVGP
jgi:hypothetical protein